MKKTKLLHCLIGIVVLAAGIGLYAYADQGQDCSSVYITINCNETADSLRTAGAVVGLAGLAYAVYAGVKK